VPLPDVLYLVPNLADAAVWRRVRMLEAGSATMRVAGFRRSGTALPDGARCIELGETFDANFAQRLVAVAGAWPAIRNRVGLTPTPDVIIARNLEMLPLAHRIAAATATRPAIVYECLDIHRLLIRDDVVGRAMRAAERRFTSGCDLLITSSPAFVREYFDRLSGVDLPVVLVENKVFGTLGERGTNPALRDTSGPLRIGWFGALRCSRSRDLLAGFTRTMEGRFEAILRGRPALTELGDLESFAAAEPHLRFEGAYRNLDDLARIYSEVHFAWAIDFFEAGRNSDWLLPNRLYEGCFHGAIPIAIAGTETAAFLERHRIGVILPDAGPDTLRERLGSLTLDDVAALARDVAGCDPRLFHADNADCRDLVARLEAARPASLSPIAEAA
jgi:succinoglycan biosynthesis protein ExoL